MCIRVSVWKPERRSLGRPRHRWEDNIKMNLRGVSWGNMDWIDLAERIGTGGAFL
jgi:hypothetical protein